jgi:hypothetical protein
MSTTPYGIVSQHREYSYQTGWTARIVYCVAAADVPAFLAGNFLDFYVASPYMEVVKITDEPWMEGDVIDIDGLSRARRITLHFAVVYLNVPWPAHIDRPAYRTGSTLKLHTNYAGQYHPIAPAAISPATAGPTVSPHNQYSQYIALNEYHVEWDRVAAANVPDFTGFAGAVNSDTFMSCAPGQLLCIGARQEPSFLLDPTNAVGWKTIVTFKQRKITVASGANAGSYGWNDWYNPKAKKWEAIALTNGQPPHNPVAFSGMFS